MLKRRGSSRKEKMGILATSFVELDPKSSTPFCIGKSTSTSVGIFKGAADSAAKVELMNIAADGTITFLGTVNTPDMAIGDNTVTASKIANNAVTTDKIMNEAVTTEKLSPDIVAKLNTLTVPSDIRIKENLEEITDASEKVRLLKAYTYNLLGHDRRTAGIIAQDLAKVLPEGVVTNPDTGIMSVDYSAVIALLVNALNEKQSELDIISDKVNILQSRIETLESRLK